MKVIKKWFKALFTQWELIYSTTDPSVHFNMLNKLDREGIKFKTKTVSFGGGYGGAEGFSSVYHIYVREGSTAISNEMIHHSK